MNDLSLLVIRNTTSENSLKSEAEDNLFCQAVTLILYSVKKKNPYLSQL